MKQLPLIPQKPVKTVQEHVRERLTDFSHRQAERDRRRRHGGRFRRAAAAPAEVQVPFAFEDPTPAAAPVRYAAEEIALIESAALHP